MYRRDRRNNNLVWAPPAVGGFFQEKATVLSVFFDLLFLFSNLSFGQLSKGFNRILPGRRQMTDSLQGPWCLTPLPILIRRTSACLTRHWAVKTAKWIEILVGGLVNRWLNLLSQDLPCLVTQMISTLRLETLNRHLGIGFSWIFYGRHGELDHPWKLKLEENWWIFFDFTVFFSGETTLVFFVVHWQLAIFFRSLFVLLEAQQAYWGALALSAHYSRPGRHRIMRPRYVKINVGMKRTFVGDAFKLVVKKTHLIVKGMGLNVERGQPPFWWSRVLIVLKLPSLKMMLGHRTIETRNEEKQHESSYESVFFAA